MKRLERAIITDIIDAKTIYSKKGRMEAMFKRRYYGLSFCIEGQITYMHKGKAYVSDKGHAVILPKGQNYTICGNETGYFPLINFDCAGELCDTILVVPIESADGFIKAYEQIQKLLLFEGNGAKIMSIFYDMLHRLAHAERENDHLLKPAIAYLENHFSESELNNATLAAQCNISEVYFRKLFLKKYAMTPKQYIIDIRINMAKQLLSDGRLKINAVAEQCGFSNTYHFSRLFKERTGLTPTAYMKQNLSRGI